ncbi:hypothetical protein KC19_3G009800 [Ceratodon purpureus]|uniref:Uncharacterized protein n=1 Tax=Ceratodon purpureus TaxID=3225 RepID=A0A8T0IH61_CERPU|nr:hypothetical protein KC19_3G009800 [Ceratodon purpureus]
MTWPVYPVLRWYLFCREDFPKHSRRHQISTTMGECPLAFDSMHASQLPVLR